MASNPDFVQYIAVQCAGAGEITVKKMFGDYGIYCDGVIFGLVSDNRFYLKPTEAGRSLLRSVEMRPPYDGAKDYFFIEDVDDRDYLSALVRETCKALPQPKLKDYSYTTERYDTEVNAREYIEGFHNADYFIKFCQQCRNYSRRYGCPPFDYDPLEVIKRYERVRIIGIKIIPEDKHIPLHFVNDLMRPIIAQLNEELLKAEKSLGGMCFGFVGTCPYCGDEPCARIDGKPCRHPDKVRPSLEAFGFDISKTAKDLLGLEIKWSKGDLIPEYLTLVGGIFY